MEIYDLVEANEQGKITCKTCGRTLVSTSFFAKRDTGGKLRYPVCKEDLTAFIDNKDRSTFDWILKIFDVPYVDKQWKSIYNRKMTQKGKVTRSDVIGEYLRLMKMHPWKIYHYEDTEKIQNDANQRKEQIAANLALQDEETKSRLLDLQRQLDEGEITQAEYDTLNPLNHLAEEVPEFIEFSPSSEIDEDEILKQLTEKEIADLKIKWGGSYKPSQWVQMEKTWNQYHDEYEMDVDREITLKQICKLNLKMEEALDIGDFKSYRDLSSSFDSLRKSASFTKAQNKEGESHFLDSIGELVSFVEQEGGIIEHLPCPDEYPQDDVDYAIRNMKSYYYDLVTNELGLGDMIEKYMRKLEEQSKDGVIDFEAGMITSEEENDKAIKDLENAEAEEFERYLENDIEDEIAAIANKEEV